MKPETIRNFKIFGGLSAVAALLAACVPGATEYFFDGENFSDPNVKREAIDLVQEAGVKGLDVRAMTVDEVRAYIAYLEQDIKRYLKELDELQAQINAQAERVGGSAERPMFQDLSDLSSSWNKLLAEGARLKRILSELTDMRSALANGLDFNELQKIRELADEARALQEGILSRKGFSPLVFKP